MDTEKSLVCRELVCLSLPSLSPLPTLRVAQYFSFMHSLPVSVLIKLTLYSSEVEDIVSVSVAQNHPKRTNIRSHYLLPQTCVWISCNSLDNLPNPRFRHVNFYKIKDQFYLVFNHFLPNLSILRQALVKPSFTC